MNPKRRINGIKSTKLMHNPAMASPRGDLNMPINEKMNPSNHNIQLSTGTQHPKSASRASTNPAVPRPFDFLDSSRMIIVWRTGLPDIFS